MGSPTREMALREAGCCATGCSKGSFLCTLERGHAGDHMDVPSGEHVVCGIAWLNEGDNVNQEHLESASVKAVRTDAVHSTLKERESQYGDYTVQAEWAQDAKLSCRQTPNWCALSGAKRESIDMIVTKLSRILHGDYNLVDSWHDIAGYANLGGGWKP